MLEGNKEKEKEKNKNEQFYAFANYLKEKKIDNLSEQDFTKEIILFFNVNDFRVVKNKKNILIALGLIEKKFDYSDFMKVVYCLP